MRAIRRFVPRAIRHGASVQLEQLRAGALTRDLSALASGTRTIVAGPWLGEVGFELLYWVPFLRWFAERFQVPPQRLVAVSRGGPSSWYRPFAGGYRELFDLLSPEEFKQRHDERVAANGEQKQTQVLAFERELLQALSVGGEDCVMLHPSSMYRLFRPYWWGHVDERWVHRYARYRGLPAPGVDAAAASGARVEPGYVAVKFYFNDCFPPTDANRAFVRRTVGGLVSRGRVISLATGLRLDDHGGCDVEALGVETLPRGLDPRVNLAVQSAIVAGASAFIGTYGGFSYLAPFYGVPSTGYYDDPDRFSARHLTMARSALAAIGAPDLLDVCSAGGQAVGSRQ